MRVWRTCNIEQLQDWIIVFEILLVSARYTTLPLRRSIDVFKKRSNFSGWRSLFPNNLEFVFFFSPQPCSKRGEPGTVHKLGKHQSSNWEVSISVALFFCQFKSRTRKQLYSDLLGLIQVIRVWFEGVFSSCETSRSEELVYCMFITY